MRHFFIVGAMVITLLAGTGAEAKDLRYTKPPAYDVISQGGKPHIKSNIQSAGYVRVYLQHKGQVYLVRKLRDSVNPRPIMQKLDAESAAFVKKNYGKNLVQVDSLDAPLTISHDKAGTYTFEKKNGQWERVGWNKDGQGGSSSSSSGSGSKVGVDQKEQQGGIGNNSKYNQQQSGSVKLCQLTGTCGGASGSGSSSGGVGICQVGAGGPCNGSSSSGNGGGYNSSGGAGGSGEGLKLCYPASGGKTVNVSPGNLQSALNAASPGDRLVLAGGTYSGSYTYNKNGTASAPIVIQGNGSQTFTGVFNLNGSYGVLSRVAFRGGRVAMNGHHNRVTRTLFSNPATPAIEMKSGGHAYNRVDHNEFRTVRGYAVEIGAQRDASKHQGHRIDHNYVFDHHVAGSEEVMRMLTDAYRDSYITYEYNLFDKVLQGERHQSELISVKTARTILRGNTVINSPNTSLTFRETNRTLAEGNYLMNGAGIRVFGDDNVIRNNVVSGGGSIEIRGGDGTMDITRSGCPKSGMVPLLPSCKGIHAAARRTLVEHNVGPISVGKGYTGNSYKAQNTLLRNNSGPVSLSSLQTETVNQGGAPNNTAKRLGMSDVGIGAADVSCNGN